MPSLKEVKEIAPILRCSEAKIRRLIKTRQIPFRKIGRRYFFTEQDINDYLEKTKHEPIVREAENE